MKVFTIIVTYNGMQWYERCFGSLMKSQIPVQIVVIDNASSDGTADFIKRQYPDILLIESDENLGFAKANNLGLRYALDYGADYVFLLNQDAWINQPETITALINLSEKYPEYAILSPLQLYGSGLKIEQETLMYLARSANIDYDFVSDLYLNKLQELYPVPFACAVAWLMPINTVKEIGGFDPIFFHYGEDDNYVHRIKYFGYRIGICPHVSICHDIENRPPTYREKHISWKKFILLHLCDINKELDLKHLLRRKLTTVITQCLRLNRKLLKKSYPEYRYIKKIKKTVEFSREQNKEKRLNWL
ncbi:MAG: glycosyltransferase family 2 protein [Mangrovibacterium sp.]